MFPPIDGAQLLICSANVRESSMITNWNNAMDVWRRHVKGGPIERVEPISEGYSVFCAVGVV